MNTGDILEGKYEILERIGAGGMGEVYKARHSMLGALRVIKIIRTGAGEPEELHRRFLQEAQLGTRVHHSNVATLHDFSTLPDGTFYTVWEFIDGVNVGQRLRSTGTIPPQSALRIAIEALHGLEAIHAAGIVHRDISPENLMLTRDGSHVKIIDLGVAKGSEESARVTQAGIFLGKFQYASPEQLGFIAKGESIDGRADLYSLAIVLYEMLAGSQPFDARTPQEYITLHAHERSPRPIALEGMPGGRELQAILCKALERDRRKRFSTARELAEALQSVENSLALSATIPTFTLPQIPPRNLETMPLLVTLPAGAPNPPAPAIETVRTESEVPPANEDRSTQPLIERTTVPIPVRSPLLLPAIVIAVAIVAAAIAMGLILRQPRTTLAIGSQKTETRAALPTATSKPAPVPATGTATGSVSATTDTMATALPTATAVEVISRTPVTAQAKETEVAQEKPVSKQRTKARAADVANEIAQSQAVAVRPVPAAQTYVYGGEDDQNEAAIASAREALAGTGSIAIRGEESPLLEELRQRAATFITLEQASPVVVHFNGGVEHLRFRKKRRYGVATVTRNGRLVLRWELPAENYLIGSSPAGELAHVLARVLSKSG